MIRALEFGTVRLVAAIVSVLPMRIVRRIGAGLGQIVYRLDRSRRRTALENLAAAFPSKRERERRALARAMFAHFGSLLLELLKFANYTPEQMRKAVDVEGEERARQAYAQHRGVLFFTGHFGYWEIHAVAEPLVNRPISVLARALDNVRLNEMLERIRTSTGNSVIYRQGAVRRILRELAANHGVALLIDQHLHTPDAVYVDFFRRPAATTSALAALALRTGAPVIPVFALPLPRGRYRLVYEHPVDPPRADTPDAVRDFTQRCTDVLEMYVRRHPTLWLWMHRRWRDQEVLTGEDVRMRDEPEENGDV
ncbi:MAG TPA: lysophospholipid acyltransferase family protein [Vicinamibacterales bacterium]|nr:lysophospholipid acyltransferase family protein [Vicinamibacterales bacterium]